jgi:hypothetical protein
MVRQRDSAHPLAVCRKALSDIPDVQALCWLLYFCAIAAEEQLTRAIGYRFFDAELRIGSWTDIQSMGSNQ